MNVQFQATWRPPPFATNGGGGEFKKLPDTTLSNKKGSNREGPEEGKVRRDARLGFANRSKHVASEGSWSPLSVVNPQPLMSVSGFTHQL